MDTLMQKQLRNSLGNPSRMCFWPLLWSPWSIFPGSVKHVIKKLMQIWMTYLELDSLDLNFTCGKVEVYQMYITMYSHFSNWDSIWMRPATTRKTGSTWRERQVMKKLDWKNNSTLNLILWHPRSHDSWTLQKRITSQCEHWMTYLVKFQRNTCS